MLLSLFGEKEKAGGGLEKSLAPTLAPNSQAKPRSTYDTRLLMVGLAGFEIPLECFASCSSAV